MAAPCSKPWRRKRKRDQKHIGSLAGRFSSPSLAVVDGLASWHRFVIVAIVVVVTASAVPVARGLLLPEPVPSRRHHRPWKQQSNKESPCHLVNARQFRHPRTLSRPLRIVANDKHATTDDNNDAEQTDETWTAGNVDEDFRNLKQAMALSVADQTLRQQERLNMLDYFARQRRPLRDDVRSHFLAPLMASFLLTSLIGSLHLQSNSLLRFVGAACDLHFWTVFVAAPAVFLAIVSFRNRAKASQDLQISPTPFRTMKSSGKHRRFLPSEPQLSVFGEEVSTDPALADPLLCLLEQWCSTSLGMLVAAPFLLQHWIDDPRIVSGLVLMTKVAAFVSLHQFPLLHYQVLRPNPPRPIALPVWAMACLTKSRTLPWSVVPDLVRLGLAWNWPKAALAHVVAAVAVSGVVYRAPRRLSGNDPRPLLPRPRLLAAVIAAAWAARNSHSLRTAASRLVRAAAWTDRSVLVVASRGHMWDAARTLLLPCAILLALVGPCVHLVAYRRLVRVSHCDGLSLADLQDDGSRPVNSSSAQDVRKEWRWRVHWREPRRVHDVAKQWRDDFFYWLFLSGSVQEKLRRELDSKLHSTRQGPAHQRGLAVLQRMARDRAAERDYGIPPADRTQWKQAAMDRLARVHKKNYERNNIEDPLGIAVYKSLGIGLGFNFDYMSPLPPGVKPSTRRLQARAAKSAVRRVQEIYDPAIARRELDGISDPIERDRRANELKEQAQREIDDMAARLSNLTPPDMILDIPSRNRVEDFSLDDASNSPSALLRRLIRSESSQALERLVDRYGNDAALKRGGDIGDDSAFVEAWERERYGRFSGSDGNSTSVTALA